MKNGHEQGNIHSATARCRHILRYICKVLCIVDSMNGICTGACSPSIKGPSYQRTACTIGQDDRLSGQDDHHSDQSPRVIPNVTRSERLSIKRPSQPTAAGRRRRISGYERRWAAILPAITRQRAAAVKTDHVICHLKRWNCLQRAFSGPLMSKWSVSGVFLNILKTFRNNHDRKN